MTLRLRSAVVLIASLTVIATAQAETTWHVDDDNCPGPGTGTEPDPFCKIQDGIDAASDGDEVLVAMGTYNETIDFNGKAIALRSSDGPQVTTIDGSGLNLSVVRCTTQTEGQVQLNGFTITGGYALNGGGLSISNCQIIVSNCIFRGNRAIVGGAIRIGGFYEPTITECIFVENIAARAAGIWSNADSPTITDCIFVQNDAVAGGNNGGGGIGTHQSNALISDCIFVQNRTLDAGGGINVSQSAAVVSGCSFLGNFAPTRVAGGGVYTVGSSETVVADSFFCGNTGGDIETNGGYIDGGGNEFLEECPDSGACCVKGVCAVLTPSLCATVKGVYQGDGATCDDGTCSGECPADLDDDDDVDAADLAQLLGNWGPCE